MPHRFTCEKQRRPLTGFESVMVREIDDPRVEIGPIRRLVRACEPLERFRPEPAECCRGQQRVDHAIEKMLERDDPASAAPNRFLGVSGTVSKESDRANNAEYLQ